MMSAALPGLFALLGVALGGWATHFSSLKREREARRHQTETTGKELRRTRREELYSIVANWSMQILTNNLTFASVMQGKLDYNDANELIIKEMSRSPVQFDRVEILIGAYCPDAMKAYAECLAAREIMNKVFAEFRRDYDVQGPFQEYSQLKRYIAAGNMFEKAADHLKAVIVEQVKALS